MMELEWWGRVMFTQHILVLLVFFLCFGGKVAGNTPSRVDKIIIYLNIIHIYNLL